MGLERSLPSGGCSRAGCHIAGGSSAGKPSPNSTGLCREVGLCPFKACELQLQLQHFVDVVNPVSTLSLRWLAAIKSECPKRRNGGPRNRGLPLLLFTVINSNRSNDHNKTEGKC